MTDKAIEALEENRRRYKFVQDFLTNACTCPPSKEEDCPACAAYYALGRIPIAALRDNQGCAVVTVRDIYEKFGASHGSVVLMALQQHPSGLRLSPPEKGEG